jgi:hypothetical protein
MFIGIALGMTTHVLLDEIFNPLRPFAYFTTVRWAHGFRQEKLFKKGQRKKC